MELEPPTEMPEPPRRRNRRIPHLIVDREIMIHDRDFRNQLDDVADILSDPSSVIHNPRYVQCDAKNLLIRSFGRVMRTSPLSVLISRNMKTTHKNQDEFDAEQEVSIVSSLCGF